MNHCDKLASPWKCQNAKVPNNCIEFSSMLNFCEILIQFGMQQHRCIVQTQTNSHQFFVQCFQVTFCRILTTSMPWRMKKRKKRKALANSLENSRIRFTKLSCSCFGMPDLLQWWLAPNRWSHKRGNIKARDSSHRFV